ncbi:hypothetical protein AAHC03_026759 [Spirometra sp. Aus1]
MSACEPGVYKQAELDSSSIGLASYIGDNFASVMCVMSGGTDIEERSALDEVVQRELVRSLPPRIPQICITKS